MVFSPRICYNQEEGVNPMAETNLRVKRNIYLMLSLVLLALSGLFAAGTVFTLSVILDIDRTSVGHIYLGNKPAAEYSGYLVLRRIRPVGDAEYEIGFQGFALAIDLSVFAFDADATLDDLVRDEDNLARFDLSEEGEAILLATIETSFTPAVYDHFEAERFIEDLSDDVSHLYQIKNYRLSDYLDDASDDTLLATADVAGLDPGDVDAIHAALSSLSVPAAERFSLLDALDGSGLTNAQLSIVASGLQAVTADTAFHSFLYRSDPAAPAWAAIGMNVRILAVNGFDFSFFNPMDFAYRVEIAKTDATTITVALYGHPYITTYGSVWERQAIVPFDVEYVEDPTLDDATPDVIVTETDDETIYRVLVRDGTDGEIWFCLRTATAPGEDPVTERIAIEERPATAAIYRENIVPKGGD